MNRKLSTLMAISLMALSTSAFAAVLPVGSKATKVEGKKYFLIQNIKASLAGTFTGATDDLDDQDRVIGMTKDVDNNTVGYVKAAASGSSFSTNGSESVNNYLWTVSESLIEGETNMYEYVFTNVATGEKLTVANPAGLSLASSTPYPLLNDLASEDANLTKFVFGTTSAKYGKTGADVLYVKKWQDGAASPANYPLGWTPANKWGIYYTAAATTGVAYELYEATDQEVSDEVLNKLYNAVGFNFDLKKGYEDVDNAILNGDGAIYAIKLANDVKLDAGDARFGFPAGTYLATETPGYDYDDTWADDLKLSYLLNCTFVAVSPSDNASNKAANQNNGEGFQLTTVSGKELNLMMTTTTSVIDGLDDSDKPCGSTINVWNAAFTVKKDDINNAGYYALALKNMYYQKTTDDASKMQTRKANVRLTVKSDASYNSDEYLVSEVSSTPSYIFKFVESNVLDAKELLSADGKSIYNIQIGADLFLESHMTQGGAYKYFAAGSAMADLDSPAYQFVITKVKDNTITFTNRVSGANLEVKLYEQGDYYSLAYTGAATYEILDIQDDGDVEARPVFPGIPVTNFSFHRTPVKLIPAEAEEITGWDVEDGTQVTIAFARDNAPTSNKMYPQLNQAGTNLDTKLTDDAFEATQWQLEKSDKPTYKTYSFAYLDKDEKVAYKTKGDTLAYYTYSFRLVDDGNVTSNYLQKVTAANQDITIGASANKGSFAIATAWDGSEVITAEGKYFISVSKYQDQPVADIENELARKAQSKAIKALSQVNNIKTYLVQDAPAVSLPTTATYVTLQSEYGNYISMNEEKDGIVVNTEPQTYRVFATDTKAAVPSFFISTGWNEEDGARDFLFNPQDSVKYYVGAGAYDKEYEWAEATKKAIFKSGILNEDADTLTTSIKGKVAEVAMKADNKGTKGGLNRFKFQIVLADDDLYAIRQIGAGNAGATQYLSSINDKLTWDNNSKKALLFAIEDTTAPTANEAIAAESVQVIAGKGVVTVQGAAGKVITVANILGQTIANQVAASDNVTIAAPAGVVVVAVDGEATKVVVK